MQQSVASWALLACLGACAEDARDSEDDPARELDASLSARDGSARAPQDSAAVPRAPAPSVRDAGDDGGVGGGDGCTLGEASSYATDDALSLFGDVVYFAKGRDLPAGHYRVTYVDGCMKYNFLQPWHVNQDTGNGPDGWWLVGESTSERIVLLPGDASFFLSGSSDFATCVEENRRLAPKEFDFAGGKLGVWLNDVPYLDNLSGEGGNNPRWQLSLIAEMCPPDLVLL